MESVIKIVPVALAAGAKFIEKVNFLRKVKDIAEEMKMETQRMHNFLEDDDYRTSNEQSQQQRQSKEFRQRVSEIREAILDAEDTVDTYLAQVALWERGLGIEKWAKIVENIKYINDVGSEIEAQNSKISTLKSEIQKLRARDAGPSSSSGGNTKSLQRRSYGQIHERNTVGLEDNIQEVVALVKEKECKLVSIYGMGGLGKTTLAKKVFNHKEVKKHFDKFAWVYVSQHVKERDVWESALVGLTSPSPEEQKIIFELKDEQLVEKLSQVQTDHKCLTVLDDIWKIGDWEKLRVGFQIEETSLSRILFTTRNKEVAEHVDRRGSYGRLKPLSDDRSLELLTNIALHNGRDEFADKKSLEDLGKKMLEHCKGLPLAITVLGGILATKDSLREWQLVHDNINAHLRRGKGDNEEQGLGVHAVLAYSYYNLPPQLKTCFLYFSLFPKGYDIPTRKLMRMWMAEGFLGMNDDRVGEETMEDVAERYLNELVSRYVVEVGKKASTRRIKKCHLHDLMHGVCLSKANEENFIHNLQREGIGKMRRICLIGDTRMNQKVCLSTYKSHSHIRSLVLFYDYDDFRVRAELETVRLGDSFKFLRILLLERIEMQHLKGFSKQIEELVLLRYLSLRRSLIRSFPSLDKLEFMETLDLRVKRVKKKNVLRGSEIWRMKQLRHLFLPKILYRYSTDGGESVQNSMPNLQTLGNFPPPNCELGKLLDFPKLKKLQVLQGNHGQEFWEMLNTDQEFIFNNLYSVTVVAKRHDDDVFEKHVALEAVLERCPCLYKLKVVGPINKFPPLNQFPKSLSNLILKHSQIHDPDHIQTILGKLPNLITLLLGNDSFLGKQLFFRKGTFPQLKSLRLKKFELSNLRVEEGAMPKLESLVINKVKELATVPEAFGLIATLNELEIRSMPAEFAARLKEGGADFNKFKNVPSITFDRCD